MRDEKIELTEQKDLTICLPILGDVRVRVEAKPSSPEYSSAPMAMVFLLSPGGEKLPGAQKLVHFNQAKLELQAMSSSNLSMTVGGMTAWMVERAKERQDFLSCDYRALNEFVSLSIKNSPELFRRMENAVMDVMEAARRACMIVHLVGMSFRYSAGTRKDDLSPEDVAAAWSRKTIMEVMGD